MSLRQRDAVKVVPLKVIRQGEAKTVSIQAVDHRMDEQGVIRLGLYDPASGKVMRGMAREETVGRDIVSFLAICWEVQGLGVPKILVMDGGKIKAEVVEFLNQEDVKMQLLSSGMMNHCAPLERAFDNANPQAGTPAPPEPESSVCEILQTDPYA